MLCCTVAVRAYDGKGKGIVDVDNKVTSNYYDLEKASPVPLFYKTFGFGSEDNPITLTASQGLPEVFGDNTQSVTFAFPADDYNGKIVITSNLTEIDATSANDIFSCGNSLTVKISDVPKSEYRIPCTHEGSKINLFFTIEPIYKQ